MQLMERTEFVSRGEIASMLGVHKKTVTRLVSRGKLPKPLGFSSRLHRWSKPAVVSALRELMTNEA
jgi:excisionase family DNA binding protein